MGRFPPIGGTRYELAGTFNNIANLQTPEGRREEALLSHRRALKIREALVDADPRVVRYQSSMAGSYNAIAILQTSLGRPEDALQTFRQFRDQMQALLAADPMDTDARLWLSSAWHNSGSVLVRLGRPAEAVSAYRQAIEHKNRVLAERTKTKSRLHSLGNHYIGLTEAERALGQHARAAATLLEQRQIWENDADGLYSLACGLAQCVPPAANGLAGSPQERQAECQRYVDLALEALRQAVAAGYRDAAHIWRDAELAPLRSRKEFHALVGDLAFPTDPFARPS